MWKSSNFDRISKLFRIFSHCAPHPGSKNENYEKSQMTFVGPIEFDNLAKNRIPRVSRRQNKRISKCENLSFRPKFPDLLGKKLCISPNFDGL